MAQQLSKDTFKYFAFGSNLLRERILINNPSAQVYGIGRLRGYRFGYDFPVNATKERWFGAAGNIFKADATSCVYGVIWDMHNRDLENLDRQETYYTALQVDVEVLSRLSPQGQPETQSNTGRASQDDPHEVETIQCRTYQITSGTGDNLPSPHYKEVVLMGARQNSLPEDYITFLESFPDNKVTETPPGYKMVMEMLEKTRNAGSSESGNA